jgi:hypothetical protein
MYNSFFYHVAGTEKYEVHDVWRIDSVEADRFVSEKGCCLIGKLYFPFVSYLKWFCAEHKISCAWYATLCVLEKRGVVLSTFLPWRRGKKKNDTNRCHVVLWDIRGAPSTDIERDAFARLKCHYSSGIADGTFTIKNEDGTTSVSPEWQAQTKALNANGDDVLL